MEEIKEFDKVRVLTDRIPNLKKGTIVTVMNVLEENGVPYYVIEYLNGKKTNYGVDEYEIDTLEKDEIEFVSHTKL